MAARLALSPCDRFLLTGTPMALLLLFARVTALWLSSEFLELLPSHLGGNLAGLRKSLPSAFGG
jgi:hypothetical protein